MANQMHRRQIKTILVANRGEIAARILQAARESSITTFALYSGSDDSHTLNADHAIELSSAADYLDVSKLVGIVKEHRIDAVHPGYGFLSESADFARRVAEETKAFVIGPGWQVLERTGDKLAARRLAEECRVPVLPATQTPTASVDDVRAFGKKAGLPIMLKAVDGGGGRGIRLVRREEELENATRRAMEESPTKQVFVEKAAIEGYRHIEVQILGDGTGRVEHLFERECSIQRRYQKIVELAPSTVPNRRFIARIVESAVHMAKHIRYLSLGTFEFLANPKSEEFYFLEVNPRLQVEHTITESISLVDIVKTQLDIAQGTPLQDTSINRISHDPESPPPLSSIQLRLTAENVQSDWSLSIGKISAFHFPGGNGVRVDTHLVHGHPAVVSADFDSLIAKIIVTGTSWPDAVHKARRALEDTHVDGVKTNLDILKAIVATGDFEGGKCDTQWLEKSLPELQDMAQQMGQKKGQKRTFDTFAESGSESSSANIPGMSSSTVLLRKGDAWSLKLKPNAKGKGSNSDEVTHHLKLTRVLRNDFPGKLAAEIEYSTPASEQPQSFILEANASGASSSSLMAEGKHRKGNPSDPKHVVIPFPGKLVEVLVDEGDMVKAGQVVCIVQQMKMELEVRSRGQGRVKWVTEAEDGEDVAEGALAAELEDVQEEKPSAKL